MASKEGAKSAQINATYCLHCSKPCKQPASTTVMHCPHRAYTTARQPDVAYRAVGEDAS